MFTQEMLGLEAEINKEAVKYMRSVADTIYEIMLKAIAQSVYQFYSPVDGGYIRTYQLLQNWVIDYDLNNPNPAVYVHIDFDALNYYSAKKPYRDVSKAVPYWVNEGHQARNYTPPKGSENNQFHRYMPPRQYLELAQQMIKTQLGIDVIIIKDAPPTV